jgi:hypothetical protein
MLQRQSSGVLATSFRVGVRYGFGVDANAGDGTHATRSSSRRTLHHVRNTNSDSLSTSLLADAQFDTGAGLMPDTPALEEEEEEPEDVPELEIDLSAETNGLPASVSTGASDAFVAPATDVVDSNAGTGSDGSVGAADADDR